MKFARHDLSKSKQLAICRYIKQPKAMENISLAFQLIVAISVLFVWIFRYENIVIEFKHYGYSDLLRNFVGASKISISTLLIVGVWYNEITIYASLSMAFFMFTARSFLTLRLKIHSVSFCLL